MGFSIFVFQSAMWRAALEFLPTSLGLIAWIHNPWISRECSLNSLCRRHSLLWKHHITSLSEEEYPTWQSCSEDVATAAVACTHLWLPREKSPWNSLVGCPHRPIHSCMWMLTFFKIRCPPPYKWRWLGVFSRSPYRYMLNTQSHRHVYSHLYTLRYSTYRLKYQKRTGWGHYTN